jgi:hypothetical protein
MMYGVIKEVNLVLRLITQPKFFLYESMILHICKWFPHLQISLKLIKSSRLKQIEKFPLGIRNFKKKFKFLK